MAFQLFSYTLQYHSKPNVSSQTNVNWLLFSKANGKLPLEVDHATNILENTDMYCKKKKKKRERGENKKGGAEICPFSPFLQIILITYI